MRAVVSGLAAVCLAGCYTLTYTAPRALPPGAHLAERWVTTLDRENPLVGKVWQTSSDAEVCESSFFADLLNEDFVLLGEQHDNPDHHRIQAAIIDFLAHAGRKPIVALEMLEPEQDAVIVQYRATKHASAAGLGAIVGWEKRGWPAFQTYLPIAETAFANELLLIGANLEADVAHQVAREGAHALTADRATRLGLDTPLAPGLEASLESELVASHCGKLPPAMVGTMAVAQRARDGQMASSLLAHASDGPLVLIAGAGHARSDRGVPLRLRAARPTARIVSVGFVEVDAALDTPHQYASRFGADKLPFDYVWFTPRATDDDPCKGFTLGPHVRPKPTSP